MLTYLLFRVGQVTYHSIYFDVVRIRPCWQYRKTTLFLRLPEQETLTKFDRDAHTPKKNDARHRHKNPPEYSLGVTFYIRGPHKLDRRGKKKGFTVIAPRLGVLGCKAKVRRGLRMTN